MPPRPFPYRLRVGTDICNVSRVRRMISRPESNHSNVLKMFLKRVLTVPERIYFWDRFGPQTEIHTKFDAVSQFLAGRFAAKEAIRKACDHLEDQTRGFHKILILPIASTRRNEHQSAPPRGLVLDSSDYETQWNQLVDKPEDQGRIRKHYNGRVFIDINEVNGQLCEISISHDGDFAIAVALVPSMHKPFSNVGTTGAPDDSFKRLPQSSTQQQPQDELAGRSSVLNDKR